MTVGVRVLENDGRVQITATGGETSLAFDFLITDEDHIRIIRTRSGVDTTLTITTDYTVPGGSINQETGGTITLTSPAIAADRYTLLLDVPYSRTTDFNPNGDFLADTLNLELDLLTQQNQQIVRDLARAAKIPESSTISSLDLPSPQASKLIGWNSGATGMSNYGIADLSSSVVTAFAQTLLDDSDAATARATLGVSLIPFTAASSSTPAYLDFAEDTDNGTNRARVIAPSALASNADITLPGATSALATLALSETLSNKIVNTAASTTSAAGLNIPHGTAPTSPVNGDTWTETGGLVVRVNGETIPYGVRSAGVSATTSGTSVTITGIPTTAKDIVVSFQNVSSNGTSNFLLQIGNGSVETSGYTSSSEYSGSGATSTAGFIIRNSGAPDAHSGNVHIQWLNGFNYVSSGVVRPSTGAAAGGVSAGEKVAAARIDRIRLTTVSGVDTFDNGAFAVSYRC